MPKDPVCGKEVEVKRTQNLIYYNGKMYYFCTNQCRTEFVNNPEIYCFIARYCDFVNKNDPPKKRAAI